MLLFQCGLDMGINLQARVWLRSPAWTANAGGCMLVPFAANGRPG
jgi:hypothetical protein